MSFLTNADLKPFNTFSVAHTAAELFVINSIEELPVLMDRMATHVLPTVVLGGGSNVLFTQNHPGRVVVNRLRGFTVVEENDSSVTLRVAAGEDWHQLVLKCLELGYYGIENLSLIPGSVGAAPVQNIGAYGVEFASVLESVEAVHLQSGEPRRFSKEDCQLSYRNSLFKQPDYADWLITYVTMRLNKKPQFILTYRGLDQLKGREGLTAKQVSQAVISLRQSKLPDPSTIANGGSFFKNPVVSIEKAGNMTAQFSACPCFPHGEGKKLSAAWLLEHSGWKGHRQGGAGVYENHSLVLVNHGDATGQEIWQLACEMRDSVEGKFGIRLEPEVKVI